MGKDWIPNRAISNPLMLKLLVAVESRISRTSSEMVERLKWMMAGSYFCFCNVVSLISSEGLMVDVAGIREFGELSSDHVIIPLHCLVKGEDHTRIHLIHCVNITDSEIEVRIWATRLKSSIR